MTLVRLRGYPGLHELVAERASKVQVRLRGGRRAGKMVLVKRRSRTHASSIRVVGGGKRVRARKRRARS